MIDVPAPPPFRDFGDGSFRAVQFWNLEDEKTGEVGVYQAVTIFDWKDVRAVQAWMHPDAPYPAPEGEKCLIHWQGGWITLLAPYIDVAKARQTYRQQQAQRKAQRRIHPLSFN